MRWLAVGVCLAIGCVTPASRTCESGRVCAGSTVCDEVHGLCVLPDQLTSCGGRDEGGACSVSSGAPGTCVDGVCLPPLCGDGIARAPEECDGADLRSTASVDESRCESHGYYSGGTVTCAPDCTYDTSACTGICGDGVLQAGEEVCDGDALGAVTDCRQLGYYNPGTVTCNALCRYDDDQCTGSCGDGVRDPVELCDGSPPAQGCLAFGYDAGYLDCIAGSCVPAFSGCHLIGWKPVASGVASDILEITSGGSGEGYAAAGPGEVLSYAQGVWKLQPLPVTGEVVSSVYSPAPGHVWAMGDGHLFELAGGVWTTVTDFVVNGFGLSPKVLGTSASDVYAFVASVTYHFDGTAWTALPLAPVLPKSVWTSGPSDYWAITATGKLSHGSLNTWVTVVPPILAITQVWGSGATVFVAGATGGKVKVARWDGVTWSVDDVTAELTFVTDLVLGGRSPTDAYLAGRDNGQVLRFDGTHWTRTVSIPNLVYSLGTIGGTMIAGSSLGQLYDESLSSAVSIAGLVPDHDGTSAVWASGCADVFVAASTRASSDGAAIMHFDGASWTTELSASSFAILDLAGTSDGAVYAATTDGSVLARSGTAWTPAVAGDGIIMRGVWAAPGGFVVAVGNAGETRRSTGGTWTTDSVIGFEALSAVTGRSPTDVFATGWKGSSGEIAHFDGTSWTKEVIPSGIAALRAIWTAPSGEVFAAGDNGAIVELVGGVWTLMETGTGLGFLAIHGTTASDVFAVADNANLFHFNGAAWEPVRSLGGMYLRDVWSSPSCTYFVGGDQVARNEAIRLLRRESW